jgi:hypothetical protein
LGIRSGIARDDVLEALAEYDRGATHDFGPPTRYELAHELRVSKAAPTNYRLYRAFSFSTDPHLYRIEGDLEAGADLMPSQYAVLPKRRRALPHANSPTEVET